MPSAVYTRPAGGVEPSAVPSIDRASMLRHRFALRSPLPDTVVLMYASLHVTDTTRRQSASLHVTGTTRRQSASNSLQLTSDWRVRRQPTATLPTPNRPLLLRRPSRSTKIQQLAYQVAEFSSLSFDGVDANQQQGLTRRMLVFLRSLDDDLSYWDGDERYQEKAYQLLLIKDADMSSIRCAYTKALELIEKNRYRGAYDELCSARSGLRGTEHLFNTKSSSHVSDVHTDDTSRSRSISIDVPSHVTKMDQSVQEGAHDGSTDISTLAHHDVACCVAPEVGGMEDFDCSNDIPIGDHTTACAHRLQSHESSDHDRLVDILPGAKFPVYNTFVHFKVCPTTHARRSHSESTASARTSTHSLPPNELEDALPLVERSIGDLHTTSSSHGSFAKGSIPRYPVPQGNSYESSKFLDEVPSPSLVVLKNDALQAHAHSEQVGGPPAAVSSKRRRPKPHSKKTRSSDSAKKCTEGVPSHCTSNSFMPVRNSFIHFDDLSNVKSKAVRRSHSAPAASSLEQCELGSTEDCPTHEVCDTQQHEVKKRRRPKCKKGANCARKEDDCTDKRGLFSESTDPVLQAPDGEHCFQWTESADKLRSKLSRLVRKKTTPIGEFAFTILPECSSSGRVCEGFQASAGCARVHAKCTSRMIGNVILSVQLANAAPSAGMYHDFSKHSVCKMPIVLDLGAAVDATTQCFTLTFRFAVSTKAAA